MFNYRVEWHNLEKNKWELYGTGRTLPEAWEVALKAIGYSKIHDSVTIFDRDDTVLWDENGFRQGKGLALPTPEKIEKL